ncbi:MAG TPA: flagellar basal body L-ring protein FlgH [Bryobacteraceae bacterium]|nr:flagellar basal body L-ring protein FlgH [Bryobacteraceae bacterium]
MRSPTLLSIAICLLLIPYANAAPKKKTKSGDLSALDRYIQEATSNQPATQAQPTSGSLWTPTSRLTNLGSDLRGVQVNDLVTILVQEQASAVVNGATQTARKSSAAASINALGGIKPATSALANLANMGGSSSLDGSGTVSRTSALSTILSARVTHVLPNGYLVLEGSKSVEVNSERQQVTVRGIIRPMDLSPGNVVTSDQLAQLEIKVDGKGVVNDATHRPNILYRILLGVLPF